MSLGAEKERNPRARARTERHTATRPSPTSNKGLLKILRVGPNQHLAMADWATFRISGISKQNRQKEIEKPQTQRGGIELKHLARISAIKVLRGRCRETSRAHRSLTLTAKLIQNSMATGAAVNKPCHQRCQHARRRFRQRSPAGRALVNQRANEAKEPALDRRARHDAERRNEQHASTGPWFTGATPPSDGMVVGRRIGDVENRGA